MSDARGSAGTMASGASSGASSCSGSEHDAAEIVDEDALVGCWLEALAASSEDPEEADAHRACAALTKHCAGHSARARHAGGNRLCERCLAPETAPLLRDLGGEFYDEVAPARHFES